MPGTLLKLLAKDKLFHSGKVPVNAELRPLKIQRYGTLKEAIERCDGITFSFHTRLSHIYYSFIPVLSLPKRDWIQMILKALEHHATRKLRI